MIILSELWASSVQLVCSTHGKSIANTVLSFEFSPCKCSCKVEQSLSLHACMLLVRSRVSECLNSFFSCKCSCRNSCRNSCRLYNMLYKLYVQEKCQQKKQYHHMYISRMYKMYCRRYVQDTCHYPSTTYAEVKTTLRCKCNSGIAKKSVTPVAHHSVILFMHSCV